MKKETIEKEECAKPKDNGTTKTSPVLVILVVICIVWAIAFSHYIWTRPDRWEHPEYTLYTPITENTTVSFTVNHSTNATIRLINQSGRLHIGDAVPTIDAELIYLWHGSENDTIYLIAHHRYWARVSGVCPGGYDSDTSRDYNIYHVGALPVYNFYLYTSDGIFDLASHLGTLKMCADGHVTQHIIHTEDYTTYTFHHSEIIGWETP